MNSIQEHTNNYSLPGFLQGIGSIFDLFSDVKLIKMDTRSDYEVIKSDWQAIGEDFYHAIDQYNKTVINHG